MTDEPPATMSAPTQDGQDPGEANTHAGAIVYVTLIATLRKFLDAIAGARPDVATTAMLTEQLRSWTTGLNLFIVSEQEQLFGRQAGVPGRGQTMLPAIDLSELCRDNASGDVTFSRYFLGADGAAHGGAISLVFDELLGRVAGLGRRNKSRTAYLHVDYRSITPIGVKLQVRAWCEIDEGRKRLLRGQIWNGDSLCAEAEGLFVTLRAGQPS